MRSLGYQRFEKCDNLFVTGVAYLHYVVEPSLAEESPVDRFFAVRGRHNRNAVGSGRLDKLQKFRDLLDLVVV